MTKPVLVGAHLSIAGGIEKSFERAVEVGASCFQIFTRSSRTWNSKLYTQQEIAAFKDAQKKSGISVVVAHAPYLINLASVTESTRQGSSVLLTAELQRAESLGLHAVVLHPGAHGGEGEDVGVERVARGLEYVFSQVPGNVVVALETMAGQGTSLGSSLESLKKIYDNCSYRVRIKFCVDTCHIYSAGYDISSGAKITAFFDRFDNVLGLDNLAVIHVNDSLNTCDARLDRHAMLGKGTLSNEIFEALMNDSRLVRVPKILETPAEKEGATYGPEIALLRSMVRK